MVADFSVIATSAFAKVNLRLVVTGRRPDGYHELSMLNVRVGLADTLKLVAAKLTPSSPPYVICHSSDLEIPTDSRNLVCRAAVLLLQRLNLSAALEFRVEKKIPVGGGVGGGSSDAASALLLLTHYLGSVLDFKDVREVLPEVALSVGADVPFFLQSSPAWVRGIGEIVTPLPATPFDGMPIALVLTPYGLSTAKVFSQLSQGSRPQEWPGVDANHGAQIATYSEGVNLLRNDLFAPACQIAPQLFDLASSLREVPNVVVGMSGSGSTLFALPVLAGTSLPAPALAEVAARFSAKVVITRMAI